MSQKRGYEYDQNRIILVTKEMNIRKYAEQYCALIYAINFMEELESMKLYYLISNFTIIPVFFTAFDLATYTV